MSWPWRRALRSESLPDLALTVAMHADGMCCSCAWLRCSAVDSRNIGHYKEVCALWHCVSLSRG